MRTVAVCRLCRKRGQTAGAMVRVEMVTDVRSSAMSGVMSTPGLRLDYRLIHAGGLPNAARLERWQRA